MDAFLAGLFDEAARRRSLHIDVASRKADGTSMSGGGSSEAALLGQTYAAQSQQWLQGHDEQLRHCTGRVFAAIRAIMNRFAGQPIRVARLARTRGRAGAGALAGTKGWRPKKEFLPPRLKSQEGQLEVLPDHPIAACLADPNPLMVAWTLRAVTIMHLELTGKAYWWIVPPGSPGPAGQSDPYYAKRHQLWPLPPSWVQPVHKDGRLYAGWKVRPPSASRGIDVPTENIVYFYYPDPRDPMSALSPLQAIARSVAADESISEAQRRIFTNSVFPGLAFTIGAHPDTQDVAGSGGRRPFLTKEQRAQIESWVTGMYRGVQRYNRPLILDALIEKVEKLNEMSPREMDFMRSAQLTERQIDEGFGVSPIVRGRIEGANRASAVAADENFIKTNINPKAVMLSEIMTAALPRLFGEERGSGLEVYVEPAVTDDADLQLQRGAQGIQSGTILANEMREWLGLDPQPELDGMLVTPQGLVPMAAAGASMGDGNPPADGAGAADNNPDNSAG